MSPTNPKADEGVFARLIAGLRGVGWDISGEELADAIWVAETLEFEPIPRETAPVARDPGSDGKSTAGRDAEQSMRQHPTPVPGGAASGLGGNTPTPGVSERSAALALGIGKTPEDGAAGGSASGLTLRTPAGRALPGSRELVRALRPLRRRVASSIRRVFDEEATIRRVADERLWTIAERPARERWLDLALVVDEGSSMVIWRETVRELRQCLERSGIFRDVRVWSLDTRDSEPRLRSGPQAASRAPGELLAANGRRVILLVSDTLGAAWHGPGLARVLDLWGRNQMLALAHLLPERLWDRTPLGTASRLRVGPPFAGAANHHLVRQPWRAWESSPGRSGLALPVFALNPPFVNAGTWSRVIAGELRARTAALLHPPPGGPMSVPAEAALSASQRVDDLHNHGDPFAWRLAQLLASAPLRLSVMRVIQTALLPESGQEHLAEFLFSDLVTRALQQPGGNDPEAIDFVFHPGVRDLLLRSSNTGETVRVQAAVGDYVRKRYGADVGFSAILANPSGATVDASMGGDPDTALFAEVAAELLQRLGGDYALAAAKYGSGGRPKPVGNSNSPKSQKSSQASKASKAADPQPLLPAAAAKAVADELRRLGVAKEQIPGLLAARTVGEWSPLTRLKGFWTLGAVGLIRLVQRAAGLSSVRSLRLWQRDDQVAVDVSVGLKPNEYLPARPLNDSSLGSAFLDNRAVLGPTESRNYSELAVPIARPGRPVRYVLTVDLNHPDQISEDQRIWVETLARVFDTEDFLKTSDSKARSDELLAGKRLLWVDDTPTKIQRFVAELTQLGAAVETVRSTEEVIARLARTEALAPIDAVLSDLKRHDNRRAGLEMLELMRSQGLSQPVGFFSWVLGPRMEKEALALGAFVCTNRFTEVKRRLAEAVSPSTPPPPPKPTEPLLPVGGARAGHEQQGRWNLVAADADAMRRLAEAVSPSTPPPPAKPTEPLLPRDLARAVCVQLIRWQLKAADAAEIVTNLSSQAWARLWQHRLQEDTNAWWEDFKTLAQLAVGAPVAVSPRGSFVADVFCYHGEGAFQRAADRLGRTRPANLAETAPANRGHADDPSPPEVSALAAGQLFAGDVLHEACRSGKVVSRDFKPGRELQTLGGDRAWPRVSGWQLAIPIPAPEAQASCRAVFFLQRPSITPLEPGLIQWLSRLAESLAEVLAEKEESESNQPDEARAEMADSVERGPRWVEHPEADRFGRSAQFEIKGVPFVFRWIEPGEFLMGSTEDEMGRGADETLHRVRLTRGFWMGQYAVTQAQWEVVMGNNPSGHKGPDLPVEYVSWEEALRFCEELNHRLDSSGRTKTTLEFRLPTEAEWEYACRAGTATAFNDGSGLTMPVGKDPALKRLGWFNMNSGNKSHPVGLKQPNNWGLYDMHGNVWEWCQDHAGILFDGPGTYIEGIVDPNCTVGTNRAVRGGSWSFEAMDCRSASRHWLRPGRCGIDLGLRLAAGPGRPSGAAVPEAEGAGGPGLEASAGGTAVQRRIHYA